MKKEKILICGVLPPPNFGHSAMYKILMESSFVDAYDITFLNMHFWSYNQHKKVTVLKLLKMIKYYFQLIWLILTKNPKYVLYNMSWDKMPFLKDFLFCSTAILLGRKVVIHDMGQYVRELYDSSNKVIKGLIVWLLKKTTACIVMGETTKSVYEGLIDSARLIVVPGSVEDSVDISTTENSVQEDDAIKHTVLYFSYMAKSKGVYTAFSAAREILSNRKDVKFIFGGPMESDDVLREFNALKEYFSSRIEYVGYIGDPIKRTELFRKANVFIFPTHRDVFGLVLLHAMAEGVPIVASREGTIPETIEDQINGLLITKENDQELVECILCILDDPKLAEQISRANRERYKLYYAPNIYGINMINAFEHI